MFHVRLPVMALSVVVVGCIFSASAGGATTDSIRSLGLNFQRIYSENGKIDSVNGRLLYSSSGPLFVKTTAPVIQNMRLENNQMLLYYPDSHKAFRIQQHTAFVLPFVQLLLWTFNRKTNLEKAGFRFDKSEVLKDRTVADRSVADRSVECWAAPKQLAKQMRQLLIFFADKNKIEHIEMLDAEGKSVVTTVFDSYKEEGGCTFPQHMTTVSYRKSLKFTENVTFDHPQINQSQEYGALFFSVPPDVRIKEIQL